MITKFKNIASPLVKFTFASIIFLSSLTQAATTANVDKAFLEEDSYGQEDKVEAEVYDPLESVNRAIFSFNHQIDYFLIHPITVGYRYVVPKGGRTAIHNMFRNLGEPITFLNATLQAKPDAAFSSLGRFMINSTFGIGGLINFTKSHADAEDFGQTLGHYGTGPGPYVVLPIFGPSNIRDGIGLAADTFSDPFYYMLTTNENLGRSIAKGIDKRESILDLTDDIDRTSLDPYATYRSLYMQHRANSIKND